MGLGLGGEVGAGDRFDALPGIGLALGGLFQSGQGGAAELDDVAAVGFQPDLFQQGAVVEQGLGMRLQPGADVRPVQFAVGEQVCGLVPGRHVGAPPGTPGRG